MQIERKVQSGTNTNFIIALMTLLILSLSITIFIIPDYYMVIAFKPTNNLTTESPTTPEPQQQMIPGNMSGTVDNLIGKFVAELSGKDEVPPTESDATAKATFEITRNKMNYEIGIERITEVTGAHLHSGKNGENGDVVADLLNPHSVNETSTNGGMMITGSITSSDLSGPLKGKTLEDLVTDMSIGEIYTNLHTSKYPDGAIRGQLYGNITFDELVK